VWVDALAATLSKFAAPCIPLRVQGLHDKEDALSNQSFYAIISRASNHTTRVPRSRIHNCGRSVASRLSFIPSPIPGRTGAPSSRKLFHATLALPPPGYDDGHATIKVQPARTLRSCPESTTQKTLTTDNSNMHKVPPGTSRSHQRRSRSLMEAEYTKRAQR
jgi:hypothetical protein